MIYLAHEGEVHATVEEEVSHKAAEVANSPDPWIVIAIVVLIVVAAVAARYINRQKPKKR